MKAVEYMSEQAVDQVDTLGFPILVPGCNMRNSSFKREGVYHVDVLFRYYIIYESLDPGNTTNVGSEEELFTQDPMIEVYDRHPCIIRSIATPQMA